VRKPAEEGRWARSEGRQEEERKIGGGEERREEDRRECP